MAQSKEYQIDHLCEVMEFGQTPIQLFAKKHEERKLKDASLLGYHRLMNADNPLSVEERRGSADNITSSGPSANRGIVISWLHNFKENPIMWLHQDKKSLKIIFRNRDYYDIQ